LFHNRIYCKLQKKAAVAETPLAQPLPETPLAQPLPETPHATPAKLQSGVRRLLMEEEKVHDPLANVTELTQSQIKILTEELHKFQQFCRSTDLQTIDYTSLETLIDELTFQTLCSKVREHCPFLTSFLELFVDTKEERKIKTASEKLLRVIHANGLLLKLGHQRSTMFPLFFGILCVSFGCGPGLY
jgi:hypothetical protein